MRTFIFLILLFLYITPAIAENEAVLYLENGQLAIPKVIVGSEIYSVTLQAKIEAGKELSFNVADYEKLEDLTKATIEQLQVNINYSSPPQVSVTASGYLNNGCGSIDQVYSSRVDNQFNIIITAKYSDGMCTMALVPFEKTIQLDVDGLSSGTYTVNVNGETTEFTL